MFELVGRALRARRGQAFTLALLALAVVVAAELLAAGTAAADRRAVATEITHAAPDELRVESEQNYLSPVDQNNPRALPPPVAPDDAFGRTVPGLLQAAGLRTVFTVTANVTVYGPSGEVTFPRLTSRADQCAELVVEQGRCPVANGEIAITSGYARLLGLKVGAVTRVTWVMRAKPSEDVAYKPGGYPALTVTVVGLVHAARPTDPYWGADGFSFPDGQRGTDAPVLTTRGTFRKLLAGAQYQEVDGLVPTAGMTPERLDRYLADATAAVRAAVASGAITTTRLGVLVNRIDQDRAAIRVAVPAIGWPLLAIGWLVINMATAYAMAGRRTEVGLVAMRGAGRVRRWWLGVGEPLVPVAAGVLLGVATGAAVGYAIVRAEYGPAYAAAAPPGTARYALVAVAGALVAVLVAARRPLRTPAVELLRDVPDRAARWRSFAYDAVVVALAVVAAVQLRSGTGRPAGVALLAPALVIVAAALVLARLVPPVAALLGTRGLRGGRGRPRFLGARLGALQLARRPGVARLFALLVAIGGLVAFAAADVDVAARATQARSQVETGALRVLSVDPTTRLALLTGVRAADPDGRWAMAVAAIPQDTPVAPPILAVDSSRLAAVASWPPSSLGAATAQSLLDPGGHRGVEFRATRIALDLSTPDHLTYDNPWDDRGPYVLPDATVTVVVQPLRGTAASSLTTLTRGGHHTYEFATPDCAAGCRLVSIDLDAPENPEKYQYTMHALRALAPIPGTITKFDGPFRVPTVSGVDFAAIMSPTPDGLSVVSSPNSEGGLSTIVAPADAPYPVPALATQPLITPFQGDIGGRPVPLKSVGQPSELPRLGRNGIMVDLGTVDRSWEAIGELATYPEVWLGPAAPPDAVDRLRANGVVPIGERTYREAASYYEGQGPAAARRLYPYLAVAAGGFAVAALALAAAVDRRRRSGELRALRTQGLDARRAAGAAYVGQVVPALLAVLIGPLVGLGAWVLWRAHSPVFADGSGPAPAWPHPGFVGGWAVAVAGAVTVAAVLAARDVHRLTGR